MTPLPLMDKERRINVHFRLPYMTSWGQSVVLTGTGRQQGGGGRGDEWAQVAHGRSPPLLPWQMHHLRVAAAARARQTRGPRARVATPLPKVRCWAT